VTTAGEYRVIYFSPDPFLGARIPVAALLRTDDGVKAVVPKAAIETAADPNATFLLRLGLRNLSGGRDIDILPPSLGPHFSLAAHVRDVPAKVDRPDLWLEKQLSTPGGTGIKRGLRVATEGRRFLEHWGVADKVQNSFAPSPQLLARYVGRLEHITHYVLGRQLLLMEPIPARPTKQKVLEVNTRFGAYRHALDAEKSAIEWSLVSYVLPGKADAAQRREVAAKISFADAVIDAANEGECHALVERIRKAA
jgi:hypothetical protein